MKKILMMLAKYVNLKGLLLEYLYDDLLVVAINKAVDKSDNTLDNSLAAMFIPVVRKELEEVLDEKLAELVASEEVA